MMRKNNNADSRIARVVQRLFIPVLCCYLLVTLSSCSKVELVYRPQAIAEGAVQIYPDGSLHTLPALQYHFYNTNIDKQYVVHPCDGVGNFEGTLPVGAYRVIATNTNAANTLFGGMDSYETAIATVAESEQPASPTRAGLTFLAQPGQVYSTILSGLTVTGGEPTRMEPQPVLLTKQLSLTFSLHDGLDTEITSMWGVLPGIYPAVHLYTHQGVRTEDSPAMAIRFETGSEGSERQAQLFLFGVYDPVYGANYTNKMELTLNMSNGSTLTVIQDLTDILSEIIQQNEGVIPLNLVLPIKLTKTPFGVNSEVAGWVDEGGKEVEV